VDDESPTIQGSASISGHVGLKVLIVEDSKASREFVAATVESISGVEAITTSSGFEALKLLPRHRFDLIITDINMPDINGLELINFVKKNPNYRETPLFIITTEGRENDRKRGMALGAAEYLVKPFEPQSLAGLLRRYLKLA
jgi:two-component system chemotaxis response regulator CheY